jgi:hypothetical protein
MNGPNAANRWGPWERGGSVLFSLPKKIRGVC